MPEIWQHVQNAGTMSLMWRSPSGAFGPAIFRQGGHLQLWRPPVGDSHGATAATWADEGHQVQTHSYKSGLGALHHLS